MIDEILSFREMCNDEDVQNLQRGMNFALNPKYSVLLMSQRNNAPYNDRIHDDGITIEYEGHDKSRGECSDPKKEDQPRYTKNNNLTENGKFIQAVEDYKFAKLQPRLVKIYEKILPGTWSLKGFFDLVDYKVKNDGDREVFIFILKLSESQDIQKKEYLDIKHTRLIPSKIKQEVWKRDGGTCVKCGSKENLHFDHDLPFSKGGTSLIAKNIKILCMKCNLKKSGKIE
jgi:hypothetical protein